MLLMPTPSTSCGSTTQLGQCTFARVRMNTSATPQFSSMTVLSTLFHCCVTPSVPRNIYPCQPVQRADGLYESSSTLIFENKCMIRVRRGRVRNLGRHGENTTTTTTTTASNKQRGCFKGNCDKKGGKKEYIYIYNNIYIHTYILHLKLIDCFTPYLNIIIATTTRVLVRVMSQAYLRQTESLNFVLQAPLQGEVKLVSWTLHCQWSAAARRGMWRDFCEMTRLCDGEKHWFTFNATPQCFSRIRRIKKDKQLPTVNSLAWLWGLRKPKLEKEKTKPKNPGVAVTLPSNNDMRFFLPWH